MRGRWAGGPGKTADAVGNCDPQAEGYSYVNLVVVMTVGSDGVRGRPTRRARPGNLDEVRTRAPDARPGRTTWVGTDGQGASPLVVGWPGTETS